MDVKYISLNVIIAAGVNAGPGVVRLLGGSVNRLYQTAVLPAPGVIPGFVKGAPAYYGRMVIVPVQNFQPFHKHIGQGFGV